MTSGLRHLLVFDATHESDPYLCWLYAAQFLATARTDADAIGFMPLFSYDGPDPGRLGMKLIRCPDGSRPRKRRLSRILEKLGLREDRRVTLTSLTASKRRLLHLVGQIGLDLKTVILFGRHPGDVAELAKLVHVGCRSLAPAMVAVVQRPRLTDIVAVGLRQLGIPIYLDIGFDHSQRLAPELSAGFAGAFSFWSSVEYPFPAQRGPEADWSHILARACPRPRAPVVLFLRPDWPNCGSFTTFKNIAMRYAQRGTVIVDIALDENRRKYLGADVSDRLWDSKQDLSPAFSFAAARSRTLGTRFTHRRRGRSGLVAEHVRRYTRAAAPSWLQNVLRAGRPDYAYVNHYFTLDYLKRLNLDIPLMLDTHDIQSVNYIHHRYCSWTKKRSETFSDLLEQEISYFRRAKSIAFVNADELELVATKLPDMDLFQFIAIPTVAPIEVKSGAGHGAVGNDEPPRRRILIVASRNQGNEANIDWFLEHVWPQIEPTGAALDLVGGISSYLDKKAIPQSWTVHGTVPSLGGFYATADVVALPVIKGAGVAIKTIEALRYGRPICATSHAFRGLGKSVQALFPQIDDAATFAEELKRLVEDPAAVLQRLEACRIAADHLNPERFDEAFDKRHRAMLASAAEGTLSRHATESVGHAARGIYSGDGANEDAATASARL